MNSIVIENTSELFTCLPISRSRLFENDFVKSITELTIVGNLRSKTERSYVNESRTRSNFDTKIRPHSRERIFHNSGIIISRPTTTK